MAYNFTTTQPMIRMQLLLNNPNPSHTIRAYEKSNDGYRIQIGDTTYNESLILTPETVEMWAISQVSNLQETDFIHFANLDIEVLILGSGDRVVFPDPMITQALMKKNIGMEVMDTAAACRTYNILLGDGRNVAAGLML